MGGRLPYRPRNTGWQHLPVKASAPAPAPALASAPALLPRDPEVGQSFAARMGGSQTLPLPPPPLSYVPQDPDRRTPTRPPTDGSRRAFMSQKYSNNPCFYINDVNKIWDQRPTYVKPDWTKDTFRKGDIISRIFHQPNTRATLPLSDKDLAETNWPNGFVCYKPDEQRERRLHCFVYTKRRYFVILYIHELTMFCLPIFTHEGNGFTESSSGPGIHPNRWKENVSLRDYKKRTTFTHQGYYSAVDAVHHDPDHSFDVDSCVDLASGTTMNWIEENILPAGRMTEHGYRELENAFRECQRKAASDTTLATWESGHPRFNYYESPPHSGGDQRFVGPFPHQGRVNGQGNGQGGGGQVDEQGFQEATGRRRRR